MTDDPCKHLFEEYVHAMEDWTAASAASRQWASTEPLSPTEDISPLTLAQTEQMRKDFEREDAARKKYVAAMDAYFVCRERNRVSR
jgi:hypothetical protein